MTETIFMLSAIVDAQTVDGTLISVKRGDMYE
jgi:hypothetical protein